MAVAAAAALGARALPYAAKVPAALKALYGSKHFLTLLIGSGILGSTALGEVGKAGERNLTREQLRLQALLAKTSAEGTKKATEESRKKSKEYMEQLVKEKREERRSFQDMAAMEAFTQSQDRQMALVLQAVQALSARPAQSSAQSGGGMLGLMRGGM